MKPIQMVDLHQQYLNLRPEIDAGMARVIADTAFINGPAVREFAEQLAHYCSVKHVIPCANGTDALQLAMMGLRLPPGGEIIMPTFTYVAVVEVACLLGFRPVLVDVDPGNFNLDVALVEQAITDDTVAIAVVHLFGQCAPMEEIKALAERHGLPVIEDAAQSIGSHYRFSDGSSAAAGTIGTVGTTSFFPSKNLGCYGDGGAVMTNNDALAEIIRRIANHGQRTKYTYERVGINSRLDTLQAAVLLAKLPHLDEFSARRRAAADNYDAALRELPELSTPSRMPYSEHVFHQYTLRVSDGQRDALRVYLREHQIPSMIYYPSSMHQQQAYADLGYEAEDFPVAEILGEEVLSLPMHPELTNEQLTYITDHILNFYQRG
ncbi:MAG: DegT/DnrJ/EryC1/StrS family aminotransferase [Tunicatimonas sp.]